MGSPIFLQTAAQNRASSQNSHWPRGAPHKPPPVAFFHISYIPAKQHSVKDSVTPEQRETSYSDCPHHVGSELFVKQAGNQSINQLLFVER